MDCSKAATGARWQSVYGFPTKTSGLSNGTHKKEQPKEKIQKIATEAAEQSHRQQTPNVSLVEKHEEIIAQFDSYDTVLAAYEESGEQKQGEKKDPISTKYYPLPASQAHVCVCSFDLKVVLHREEISPICAGWELKLCGLGPRIYEQKQHHCIF